MDSKCDDLAAMLYQSIAADGDAVEGISSISDLRCTLEFWFGDWPSNDQSVDSLFAQSFSL